MLRPRVNITAMNGGLNILPPSEFGTSAVLVAAPVAPAAGYGTAFLVKSKAQIKTAFGQAGNEAVLAALQAFFNEAPEGTKLFVLAMASTTNMETMLAEANASKVLTTGNVRLMAAIKFPGGSYVPDIEDGFDTDVNAAVIAAQTLADTYFQKKKPFRAIVEGFAFDGVADTAKDYGASSYRNVAICVGNVDGSTALATMLLLGRAAGSQPQQNIGRIKSGSIKIAETSVIKIGSVLVDSYTDEDLDTLWEKRYITPEKNQTASGYVWNDDNMLTISTDDYNSLRNGRVIDNAVRVAFSTYYQELKDDVDVDEETGRISGAVEKALENAVEVSIDRLLGGQLSSKKDGTANVECMVNPDPVQYEMLYTKNGIQNPNFNLLQTNQIFLFVRCKPKGVLKFIDVYLGFTS
ncbi:MAG: hypothetical protein JSR97_12490 [Verrucomicrobia bacterium]|nr:hypothetical protein [Verrucomicrobiota bacterium]